MIFLSHMCPWLPAAFFEKILQIWSEELGEKCELQLDLEKSGPSADQFLEGADPFTQGRVEAGIVCAPCYLWSRRSQPPRLRLAGWNPVFEDNREAVYHSIVLVRRDSEAKSLQDLCESKWAFNDPCSLSGYFSVLSKLNAPPETLKENSLFTGGHFASIQALTEGKVEACAVDSNGWLQQKELRDSLGSSIRELIRLGPFPAQPLVLSNNLPESRLRELQESLTATAHNPDLLKELNRDFGLVRFCPSRESDFDELKRQLSLHL